MGVESPKPVSTPQGMVFLGYASDDDEATARIATALRVGGADKANN